MPNPKYRNQQQNQQNNQGNAQYRHYRVAQRDNACECDSKSSKKKSDHCIMGLLMIIPLTLMFALGYLVGQNE
ncbi:MAG: hypothetical protein ATN36_00560 [Epulopiscium sp. Nele67-Bin005]|nr:MAG: hypothetical protein ATN36_00560 [Epulopiscium sp. Nele67-Bin005]